MHAFDSDMCSIGKVYCGDSDVVPARKRGDDFYYTRKGTPRECLMVGFGGGAAAERSKNLPRDSLQKIKYVGETYDAAFKAKGVNNLAELVEYAKWNKNKFNDMLNEVLTKKNGTIDKKARNSVLLYVYNTGVNDLPSCDRM